MTAVGSDLPVPTKADKGAVEPPRKKELDSYFSHIHKNFC